MTITLTRDEADRLAAHLNRVVLDYGWSANFKGNTSKRRAEAREQSNFYFAIYKKLTKTRNAAGARLQ